MSALYGAIQRQKGAGAPRHSPDVSLRGGQRPTWQSRGTWPDNRKFIGEIATACTRLPRPLRGLAMTNLGVLRGRRSRSVTCQPARRSLSAATFSLAQRPCAMSAATPHTSVHAILTIPGTNRSCSAGPGCPLPCNEPVPRRFFSIVPYSPGKIHPAGKKLLLSVKSMEKRLKTGLFCDTINLYQNECTARRRGLHLHTDTTILGGKHHECSRDHGTAQRIFL